MIETKEFIKGLEAVAKENNRPYESSLDDWMDYLIEFHDVRHFSADSCNWVQHVVDATKANAKYFELMMNWFGMIAEKMEKGEWFDLFGTLYEEMFLLRGKASKTGQFFTPPCLSDLMSAIAMSKYEGDGRIRVSDCAAGSGRLLVSHYIMETRTDHQKGRKYYYEATDNDPLVCKMSALNMMIHGMNGRVICQNTLTLDTPKVVYHINEVRYPFTTPYYSIRREAHEGR